MFWWCDRQLHAPQPVACMASTIEKLEEQVSVLASSSKRRRSSSPIPIPDSHAIGKPRQQGAIRVVHIFAPKVIKTDVNNFRALVQHLTGHRSSSCAPTPSKRSRKARHTRTTSPLVCAPPVTEPTPAASAPPALTTVRNEIVKVEMESVSSPDQLGYVWQGQERPFPAFPPNHIAWREGGVGSCAAVSPTLALALGVGPGAGAGQMAHDLDASLGAHIASSLLSGLPDYGDYGLNVVSDATGLESWVHNLLADAMQMWNAGGAGVSDGVGELSEADVMNLAELVAPGVFPDYSLPPPSAISSWLDTFNSASMFSSMGLNIQP